MPITESDFPKLISWAKSEEFLIQWTGRTFTYPLNEKQLSAYFKLSQGSNAGRLILKAVDGNIHVGNITVDWVFSKKNDASITCIIVGENDYKGKGVGELIVKEAVRIAFNELNKKKIYLNVFNFNLQAIRCYKKCGFKEVLREKIELNGKEYINIRMEKKLLY